MLVNVSNLEIYFLKMKSAFGKPPTDEPVPTHYHQAYIAASWGNYLPCWCKICKKDFPSLRKDGTCSKECADRLAYVSWKIKK